ncbi:MAG: M60 family metallopeptidase [Tepidisphaerales bacterium]
MPSCLNPCYRSAALCLLACLTLCPVARAADADLDALLAGVSAIAATGVPGPVVVFGERVFPVIVGREGRNTAAVVAAGRAGKGRVFVFGHNGYLGADALAVADTGRLMKNAVAWTAGENKAKPRVGLVGLGGLAEWAGRSGFEPVVLQGGNWIDKLAGVDVLIAEPAGFSDAQVTAVRRFIEAGGGFIGASLGWGWMQLNPGKHLPTQHGGNQLLAPMGLVWADGTLDHTAKDGYDASKRPAGLVHAGKAMDAIEAMARKTASVPADQIAQAGWSVTQAAQSLPPGDTLLLPRLNKLGDTLSVATPSPKKPLKVAADPLGRLSATLWYDRVARLAPEQIKAHPAAEFFPGPVPVSAARVTKTVEIDLAIPGWHSTGLYAAPGEVVSVKTASAPAGLRLRIGCHTDGLWDLDSWSRMPQITTAADIKTGVTRAASAFGGLIYIDVARPTPGAKTTVEIAGAVEAPLFVLGKTDPAEWKKTLRNHPGPWAEIAATRVIVTVPAQHVRNLEDPEALAKFWDQVLDADADLVGIPHERPRPERYVADAQISAGYMHSGYPIMTHLDVADLMVDREAMLGNKREPVWGLFHEMGHNHQSGLWTFDGTVEVTCNLFSRYCLETVCGIPTEKQGKGSARRVQAYLQAGGDWEKWKSDPFLALGMYDQLKDGFGWDAYKKVFKEYRDIPRNQRPRSEQDKRDQWMVRFSKATGKNLGPFFQAWGVPTSEEARKSVEGLPVWMPEQGKR